jgi:acyl-CoA reductase-like NAD-dependent aldehyde dehydrogenase
MSTCVLLTWILNQRRRALCFTGSHATGRQVARAAALAAAKGSGVPPRLLLELGGKDAAYVRADADVERAVR